MERSNPQQFSLIGRSFGEVDIDNNDRQNSILTANNYFGPVQLLVSGMQVKTLHLASYGMVNVASNWDFAPSLLAQHSADRYVRGDDYRWLTLNTQLMQNITENFVLGYEASWQYRDLDPNGYQEYQKVRGNFYRLTFAPTFRASNISPFFSRPELRLLLPG